MFNAKERGLLVSFADRVSKLENVYVRCRRGRVKARAQQVWRIDGDEHGCHDVGELFDDIAARLLEDPTAEKSWIEAVTVGKQSVRDTVTIGPLDVEEDEGPREDPRTVAALSAAVTKLTSETLSSRDADVMWYRRRLAETRELLTEARTEAAELRALLGVEMVGEPDLMATAIEHFAPIARDGLKLLGLKKALERAQQAKALPGPTAENRDTEQPSEGEEVGEAEETDDEPTAEDLQAAAEEIAGILQDFRCQLPAAFEEPHVDAMLAVFGDGVAVPTVDEWTPERADQVVALVEDLAKRRLDLITNAHLERLVPHLQGRIVALMF